MKRLLPLCLTLLLPWMAVAQESGGAADQAMIRNAMSAAPNAISGNATIIAWPAEEGGEFRVLREGTNGWVCYPNTPPSITSDLNDPMCLDQRWQTWAESFMAGVKPSAEGLGIAYMLRGDRGSSNTDPFATEPTPDNDWVVAGPHLMVLVSDPADLEGIPTDPRNGGPWVMWKGTAYAHIMVPLENPPER